MPTPPSSHVNASGVYLASGGSEDYAKRIRGNELAEAYTGSSGVFFNANEAVGKRFAYQMGGAYLSGESCAFVKTFDYGLTSGSFAVSKTEISGMAGGFAMSDKWSCGHGTPYQTSISSGYIQGFALQQTVANEVGYTGANAAGANFSEAEFMGITLDGDASRRGLASSGVYMSGNAEAKGFTIVSVDPYGNQRSASGITGAMSQANVYGADMNVVKVQGEGFIGTEAYHGGSTGGYATGTSTFNYAGQGSGSITGSGLATSNSFVNVSTPCYGCNSFTAGSYGSSISTVKTGGLR